MHGSSTEAGSSASQGGAGSAEASSAPAEGPVDLATFAAVSAGVADGFAEDDVLAHHSVPAATWVAEKTKWTRRLVDEGQDGPLFTEYRAALHKREDELGREVEPIDRELDSWLGFVAATQAEDPAGLFARTGLRLPDLSRLSRSWASRLDADAELSRKAEERRSAGVTPEVPPLRLGQSSLFGRSPPPPEKLLGATPASGDLAAFDEVSVAEYVAVMARIERPENLLLSVLRAKLIHPGVWERERARIEAVMAADPVFKREVSVLMSFERSRMDVVRAERSPSVVPPPAPTLDDVSGEMAIASYAPSSAYAYSQTAYTPQHTPSGPQPAYGPQHTPSGPQPAYGPQHTPSGPQPAYGPQHTPSHALPSAPQVTRYESQSPPSPETPYVEPFPTSYAPVFSFEAAPEASPVRAEAYAFEPPAADDGLLDGGFAEEGTCAIDLDEATSFQLPFALPAEAALPFAVHSQPAASPVAATDAPGDEALPISLEDHARLHVELNAGYSEAEVLLRYGLAWDARPRVDAMIDDWKRRDPRVAEVWLAAFQAHATWLLQEDAPDA